MSTAILDRARAFEMIAAHLPEERRAEIAEAIAVRLLGEIGGGKPKPPAAPTLLIAEPETVDLSEHTETASFLVDHGYTGAELVKATGRLTEYLARHPNLTRTGGMHAWLREQKDAA